jgi:hypothetical protein
VKALEVIGLLIILFGSLLAVIAIYKFGVFPMFRSMSEDRRKRRAPQADPHDRKAP